jgi:hypothetical protein
METVRKISLNPILQPALDTQFFLFVVRSWWWSVQWLGDQTVIPVFAHRLNFIAVRSLDEHGLADFFALAGYKGFRWRTMGTLSPGRRFLHSVASHCLAESRCGEHEGDDQHGGY